MLVIERMTESDGQLRIQKPDMRDLVVEFLASSKCCFGLMAIDDDADAICGWLLAAAIGEMTVEIARIEAGSDAVASALLDGLLSARIVDNLKVCPACWYVEMHLADKELHLIPALEAAGFAAMPEDDKGRKQARVIISGRPPARHFRIDRSPNIGNCLQT